MLLLALLFPNPVRNAFPNAGHFNRALLGHSWRAPKGYEVADEEFTLLWKLVRGSPGMAEALLENANEIAASQGVKRGIEALEGAVRYFPTFRK